MTLSPRNRAAASRIAEVVRAPALYAVLAAYAIVFFALCPQNYVVGFPVHHDDFSYLSTVRWSEALQFLSFRPRPIAFFAGAALSAAGIPFYYGALHVLLIVYVWIAFDVLKRLLEVRQPPIVLGVLIAAAMFSYENAIEYSKYTGLVTNFLSGIFGMAAISLLFTSQTDGEIRRPQRYIAIWALAALSFWSKEDFIVPVLLVAAYVVWDIGPATREKRWGRLLTLAGLVLLAVLLAVYNRSVHSGFTQATSGPYKPDFTIGSMLRVAGSYLTATPVATLAAVLQASTLLWNAVAAAPIRWSRMFLFHGLIGAMLLPYTCLPNHIAPYYGFAWIAWQIGGSLLILWRLKQSAAVRWMLAAIAILCVAIGIQSRRVIVNWYAAKSQVNRNAVGLLVANRNPLASYRVVAVTGAPFLGPWFRSNGEFLKNRYGLDHRWLIAIPRDGEYGNWLTAVPGGGTQDVQMLILGEQRIPTDVPVVRLREDGKGVVDLPSR